LLPLLCILLLQNPNATELVSCNGELLNREAVYLEK
jgi:hypothetical protein